MVLSGSAITRSARTTLLCVMALACSRDPPVVYVPGEAFHESLHISTGRGTSPVVGVDEPLTLHARRTSGPWVPRPRADVHGDVCWSRSPPPEVEHEVADNVRWLVNPDSVAVFNIRYRPDRTREVRFSKPGVYSLTAHSSTSCVIPASADTIAIRVIDR